MPDWLSLRNMLSFLKPTEQPKDVFFDVFVSPYEVPDAVRGMPVDKGRAFRIEFRYIDGVEPGVSRDAGDEVIVTEGKYTGRILAIQVGLKDPAKQRVGLKISTSNWVESHLDQAFARSVTKGKEHANPAYARDAFNVRREQLMKGLEAVAQ